MLSVKKILAGRGAVNYYLDQTRRGLAAYYLPDSSPGESDRRSLTAPGSAWWGGGAAALGLHGTVDRERFVPMYTEGLRPGGEHSLGRAFRLPADVAHVRYLALRESWRIEDPDERARVQFEASQLGGRPSVAAWDCTFSPVKSVSLLWAAGDAAIQQEVWAAHTTAVDHGLDYLEEHGAYVRAGRNGVRVLNSDGLVVARMNEWTSRSGDMQLHSHCLVLNRARTTSDGKWRALDGRELLAARIGAGAVYNRVLESELTRRLGVAWRDRPDGLRELVGVEDELVRLFSARRRSIAVELGGMLQAYEDTYGVAPSPAVRWSMAQHATLATRNGKRELPAGEALAAWEETARATGRRLADLPRRVVGRRPTSDPPDPPTDVDALGLLAELATTEHATVNRHGLLRAALDVLPAAAVPAAEVRARAEALVDRALATPALVRVTVPVPDAPTTECRRDGTSVWERPGRPLWALRATLDQEDYLLRATPEATGLTVPDRRLEGAVARHGLGPDQADAVRALIGDDQRIGLLVGAAGSGKTRALRAAVDAWQGSGREVVGLTVSQSAAEVLAVEADVRAENIAKWRLEVGRGRWHLSPGSLLIVDEASMVTTPDLVDLVVQVRQAGARMLLVGDPAQLDAIGIGGAFELLVDRHGATQLHEVRRFAEPWEREASIRLRDREPTALVEYLRHGRVYGGTTAEVEDEMFRAWQRDVLTPDRHGKHPTVLMIVRTNAQAATMSERARWVRLRAGLVDPGATVQLHNNVASRGDQIVTRRNDRRLQTDGDGWVVNGDVWTVAAVHRDGSATAVRTRDGDRLRLPRRYLAAHTHLAYATTAHRAQGMTVDRCHAFIDGSEAHHLLYVAATRGRESNHLWVGLETPRREVIPGSPISVLLAILQRENDRRRSATAIRDELPATLGGMVRR